MMIQNIHTNNNKIKIGLILDSLEVYAWVHHAIERLTGLDSALISLIFIIKPGREMDNDSNTRVQRIPFLYKMFDRIDKKIFIREKDAFEKKSLNDVLEKSELIPIEIDPTIDQEFSEVTELLRTSKSDLLVNFSSTDLPHKFLSIPRLGIWSYRYSENKTIENPFYGYWEVIKKEQKTNVKLVMSSEKYGADKNIFNSHIATYKLSPNRNRNSISWFASSFLARQVELLSVIGERKFIEKILHKKQSSKSTEEYVNEATIPRSWEVIKNEIILITRIIKEIWHRLFFKEGWHLLIQEGQNPNFDILRCKRILPPEDRFWADPFPIDYAGRNFIFVEEFLYKQQKGHISVIELDQSGDVMKNYPILETENHLSYPCVFHYLGKYYMVPESSANKTIDLYECQIPFVSWKHKLTLMENIIAVDPTLFHYQGKWWLFTGMREIAGVYPDVELFLFFSDSLFSKNWTSHPNNPIVSDVSNARPAGMPFFHKGKLYRPSQNCLDFYGSSFNINEIIIMNEINYKEHKMLTAHPGNSKHIKATHTFNYFSHLSVMDALTWKSK